MIRRHVLILCTAVAVAGLGTAPAQAQYPVIDAAAIQHMVSELAVLNQQYQQLQQTFTALAHLTRVNGLATELATPALQSPMPLPPQANSLLNGSSYGQQNQMVQSFLQQNRYYQAQGNDFAAQEMARRANTTAGIQVIASQALEATAGRIANLAALRAEIDSQGTAQDMAAMQARLAAEHTIVATQQLQAQQLQQFAAAQARVEQQRVQERRRQDAETYLNDTQPLSAPAATIPNGPGT